MVSVLSFVSGLAPRREAHPPVRWPRSVSYLDGAPQLRLVWRFLTLGTRRRPPNNGAGLEVGDRLGDPHEPLARVAGPAPRAAVPKTRIGLRVKRFPQGHGDKVAVAEIRAKVPPDDITGELEPN